MDESDEPTTMTNVDAEVNQLLGLFDAPAFVRRGQDLEYALARVRVRCLRERDAMLDMVRVRLRQWAGATPGPDAWETVFTAPIAALWPLCASDAPSWSDRPAPPRRQRAIARDLIASAVRFNRRWIAFLDGLNVEHANRLVDQYNRYYLLEKECFMGSVRLAARHFTPKARLTRESLLNEYPTLPVPSLID